MLKERPYQRAPERDVDLVRGCAQVFLNLVDSYAVQKTRGHSLALHQPLTLRVLWLHLQGQTTLGTYALSAASRAGWA